MSAEDTFSSYQTVTETYQPRQDKTPPSNHDFKFKCPGFTFLSLACGIQTRVLLIGYSGRLSRKQVPRDAGCLGLETTTREGRRRHASC